MEDSSRILADKKKYIGSMFDSIAWRYDFLNHFLSFGTDKLWRRKAIKIISRYKKEPSILDVATGTGDLAIAALRLNPSNVTGIDISAGMLEEGKKKILKYGLSSKISLLQADSENMPFESNTYDVVMVAFGIRNFSDPVKGLAEMLRVLNNSGLLLVLEFSRPQKFPFRNVYNFYFKNILPLFGRIFSGDKGAYSYLPESVMKFPDNERFIEMMNCSGFKNTQQIRLTGGVASIYTGFKEEMQ